MHSRSAVPAHPSAASVAMNRAIASAEAAFNSLLRIRATVSERPLHSYYCNHGGVTEHP